MSLRARHRFAWASLLLAVILLTASRAFWAHAEEPQTPVSDVEPAVVKPSAKGEVVLSKPMLERIAGQLKQLRESQAQLRAALDELKAEIAVIKVRATN